VARNARPAPVASPPGAVDAVIGSAVEQPRVVAAVK
jgi:hypothetical protein